MKLDSTSKIKILSLIPLIVIFSSSLSYAAPKVTGYVLKLPNKYWPYTVNSRSYGTEIQQLSPFTNPDVFCDMQNDGIWRLPSFGEIHMSYRLQDPFHDNDPTRPGHWSNYYLNGGGTPEVGKDYPAPRKTPIGARAVGGLYNEWGNFNEYGNGWDQSAYWLTEPISNFAGRRGFIPATNVNTGGNSQVTQAYGVACVTDLVPTPFLVSENTRGDAYK